MKHHSRSTLLLWQGLSSPEMPLLSPHPHHLPGTRQMTISKQLVQQQRGSRVPPSPSRVSQLTPSEARRPPSLQRAWMLSRLCAGPKASGLLSVIILRQRAIRPQWRTWTGLSLALADRVASFLMDLQASMAKWRVAMRTTTPVSLMSSLGFQIRQQQQPLQENYQVVKLKKQLLLIRVAGFYMFLSSICYCVFLFTAFCTHACFVTLICIYLSNSFWNGVSLFFFNFC